MPELSAAQACLDAGWEFNAHAFEQVPMHRLEDERASVFRALEVIEKFAGRRPRGWFGPGLTETYSTLDYLSEAGIAYIGDWAFDDQPVPPATTTDRSSRCPDGCFRVPDRPAHGIALVSGAEGTHGRYGERREGHSSGNGDGAAVPPH